MKTFIHAFVAISCMACFNARAEFRLEGTEDRPAPVVVAPSVAVAAPSIVAITPPIAAPKIGVTPPIAAPISIAPAGDNVFGTMRRTALTQIGAPASPPGVVQGFGKQVTVVSAVGQVLPSGWKPLSSGPVDPKRQVSWKGSGRTWLAVIDDIAEQAGLMAQVDWAKQEVTFYAVAEANVPGGNVADVPAKKTIWELKAGRSLQENLESWAKEAGWILVWRPDFKFMITADVSLNGEFDGDAGVVARVTNAYRNSESPIIPEFFLANRVVEIRELSYSAR